LKKELAAAGAPVVAEIELSAAADFGGAPVCDSAARPAFIQCAIWRLANTLTKLGVKIYTAAGAGRARR